MKIGRIILRNWRNFQSVDVRVGRRVFLVGPNASGKSNLLDAIRFLRDVARPKGGLRQAVDERKGVSQIRSLHARRSSAVSITVEIDTGSGSPWCYRLDFTHSRLGPVVDREIVERDGATLLDRPDEADRADPSLLTQTHLEQVNANKKFRAVAEFLDKVQYLHLVPQVVRDPERSGDRINDPFGGDLLQRFAELQRANRRTFDSRLKKVRIALQVAVPQLKNLVLERDVRGVPHLRGLYEHWRPRAGWQAEDQFSDGTLRLLGLLWALLDGDAPLLLEEPELSLHGAVVRVLPGVMARIGRKSGRQVFVSTHSPELLNDEGIAPEEVLVLQPSSEGTRISTVENLEDVSALLESGIPMGEAVMPRVAPRNVSQLLLFKE